MNEDIDTNDPLEAEFRALQPRELSDGFVESLRQRLEPSTHHDDRPRPRRVAVLFGPLVAVAAVILVAIWLVETWSFRKDPTPRQQVIAGPAVEPRDQRAGEVPRPTLFAYSRAISNQPGKLEELLDHHARTLLPRVPETDPTAMAVTPRVDGLN